ncbi:MAG: outer membrane protein assembly factor BamA [Candidatus Dadabacteria bacterium]|nr:MAG: outer membrane protein assembly factor BamA [Candidatus Dadabacteria bacterium]
MIKYTATYLLFPLLFFLFINFSITSFSQESEDVEQQFEDNTSLQQEENDIPPALDEILDKKESQPQGSSDSSAATKDSESTSPDEPNVRVSKVKIKGAKVVTKQQIERIIGTDFPSIKFWVKKPPFDEEVLKDDMIRIQRLYANNGYYDAKATYELKYNKDETRVEIKITIEEGEPIILTDIDLKIEGDLSDEIKKQITDAVPLKVDETFSPNGYQQTKGVISEILYNRGYPKSDIEGEALVNRREKWARAKFVVKPGLIYKFGVIKVEGNEKVASYIIEREADFKEGKIFSLSKINETQANIFQLGLFRSVVIDPVYNDEEQIADIAIVVKERKQGSVKIGGGFGTEDKLRGQVIWTQRNFFGGGRRLEVSGKFSFITQRVETSVIQPYIVGKDSELSGTLNFQRDDVPSFKGRSFLTTAALTKDFWKYYSVFSSLNLQFSKIEDSATRTPEERSRENFFLTFINLGFERDATDNILNPTRGTVVSTGLESSFSALGSDVNYLKGTIELRGYKEYRDVVFAKKFTIGVIQPFGSTQTLDIPIFKRFFAGGSTSMRGFPFQKLGPLDRNNDPLGGNSLLVGSFEVRYPIYGDFGGVAFLDYGNVYTDEWSFPLQDIKYAPGLGLRYDTIIGPVRFDVGYALNPEPGITRIQFFISIGQAF